MLVFGCVNDWFHSAGDGIQWRRNEAKASRDSSRGAQLTHTHARRKGEFS